MIFVHQLMTPDPKTLPVTMAARQAARELLRSRVHGVPVVDGKGTVVGVVSLVDVVGVRERSLDGTVTTVGDVMTSPPITVAPGATLYEAAAQMVKAEVHRLLVVEEDGRLIGIVTPFDILRGAVNLQEGFSVRAPDPERRV